MKKQNSKITNNSPSAHRRITLSGCVFATEACIDNQKKNLLNSNISWTCPHYMVNFGPLTSEIGWHPQQIQRVSRLRFVTAPTEVNQTLQMFGRLMGWYTVYTFWGSCPWRNFARCKIHFAFESCVLLYWHRYCKHSSSGHQPNFAAWYKEWNYGTFAPRYFAPQRHFRDFLT